MIVRANPGSTGVANLHLLGAEKGDQVRFSVRKCSGVCLWIALVLPAIRAQDNKVQDLTGLSVEDLSRIRLFTASRHLDDPRKAPSAVTVIDGDEIRRYGWRTLAELLNSVTGFYTAYDRSYHYLGMRGFLNSGDYNARYLLLIDGHRLNENVYDSALIGTEFPLDISMIDHVEILRGSGSSLYGTNAELAVVNVITIRPPSRTLIEVSSAAQSFAGRTGEMKSSFHLRGIDGVVAASLYRSNGAAREYYPEFDTPETNNGIAENIDGDRYDHIFAVLHKGQLRLEGLFGSRMKIVPNASYGTVFNDPSNRSRDRRGYLELSYNRSFNAKTDFDFRLYYDAYRFWASYPYPSGSQKGNTDEINVATADWIGAETVLGRKLGRHRIVAGADWEHNLRINQTSYDVGQTPLFDDTRNPRQAAIFGEAELNPASWFSMNLGGRIDWHSDINTTYSPRLAFMLLPNATTSIKYIYNQAFRAPDPYDQYDVDTAFFGNPTLTPEFVHSQMLIVSHKLRNWGQVTADAYNNNLIKTIEEYVDPASGNTLFANEEGDKERGLELELTAQNAAGWSGRASYAYAYARPKQAGETAINSPKNLAKLDGTVPLFSPASLGVELLYTSAQQNYTGVHVSPTFLVNATLSTRPIHNNWEFSLSCNNLFDRRWATPTGPEITAPATVQDGRTVRFRISYHWNPKTQWSGK